MVGLDQALEGQPSSRPMPSANRSKPCQDMAELVSGKAKANGQVGKTLFQKVMAGDTTAAIWWSKTQMRWAETQKHELTGADGAPLEFTKIERVIVKNG